MYFHSQGGSTVGIMVIVERTSVFDFLSRVSIVTRDIDIANLSVRPSVRNIPVSDENVWSYFFHHTVAKSFSFISIKHLHEIPMGSPHAGALNIGGV